MEDAAFEDFPVYIILMAVEWRGANNFPYSRGISVALSEILWRRFQ